MLEFSERKTYFMKVPKGFEKHYSQDVVLKPMCTIYGFKLQEHSGGN